MIPNEIWLQIIRSLPQPHVSARRLLPVSRTLYTLAQPIAHRILIVTEKNLSDAMALFADPLISDGFLSETAAQRICRYTEVLIIRTQKWNPTGDTLQLFIKLSVIQSLEIPLRSIMAKARRDILLPSLSIIQLLERFTLDSPLPPTVKRFSIRYRDANRSYNLPALVNSTRNKQLEYVGLQIFDHLQAGDPLVLDDQDFEAILHYLLQCDGNRRFVLHTRGRASEDNIWTRYTRVIDDLDEETKRSISVWRDMRDSCAHMHDTTMDTVGDLDLDIEDAEGMIDMWSQARPVCEIAKII